MFVDTDDIMLPGAISGLMQTLHFYHARIAVGGAKLENMYQTFSRLADPCSRFQNSNLYFLCASAYTAADVNTFANFKGRCFKWGYFTKVDMNFKLASQEPGASSTEITPLMWCARFLSLKHPELPVKLARRLKDKEYRFVLNMYGSGVELERTQKLALDLDVCDVVNFSGVLPNEQILEQMKRHEVFLFTSDFNEGWGAVLNESMSCGCVPVASHAIGSVTFLIQHGVNGFIYENGNLDSLTEKVEFLLQYPENRFAMRQQAIKTMQNQWNAENAAVVLFNLQKKYWKEMLSLSCSKEACAVKLKS